MNVFAPFRRQLLPFFSARVATSPRLEPASGSVSANAAIGLYNHVVPDAELMEVAMDHAKRLAAGPTMGIAITKRMLNAEASMSMRDALQLEGWVQAECMAHPDYHEAHTAFLEKRAPDFTKSAPKAAAR